MEIPVFHSKIMVFLFQIWGFWSFETLTMADQNLILVKIEPNGIAFFTINRPKSLNSLTKAMKR